MKKILFFGTPDIAVPSLEALADRDDIEIVAVCVFPDRKVGRKQILTPCPVKASAQALNLPIREIETKEELKELVATTDFDIGIVIAFGMIFPAEVLASAKFINVHFSLLPKYRGASPVQSALLNGEDVSGITFQQMVTKLDAGDILLQKEYPIENKNTSSVFQAFSYFTAEMLPDFLDQEPSPRPQAEKEATFCTKFTKADGEVFPEKETAEAIYRKFLAFDVFPGIFIATEKGNVKLTEVTLQPDEEAYALNCANGTTLFVTEAQVPGKTVMKMADILRGTPGLFGKVKESKSQRVEK